MWCPSSHPRHSLKESSLWWTSNKIFFIHRTTSSKRAFDFTISLRPTRSLVYPFHSILWTIFNKQNPLQASRAPSIYLLGTARERFFHLSCWRVDRIVYLAWYYFFVILFKEKKQKWREIEKNVWKWKKLGKVVKRQGVPMVQSKESMSETGRIFSWVSEIWEFRLYGPFTVLSPVKSLG